MVSLTVTADDQQGICKYSAMMLEHSELVKALQKLSVHLSVPPRAH